MLNKEISVNKKLPEVSTFAQLLFTWCIPHLDCEGKIFGNPEQIKGIVVPYLKNFSIKRIEKCLAELNNIGLILLYGDDCKYISFNGFSTNQRIDKGKEAVSIIPDPAPEELQSKSGITPGKVKISKDKLNDQAYDFESLWKKYPRKEKMKDALKHFNASVKTEQDWIDINNALDNYCKTENVQKGITKYIQQGGTWFNNWRDYIVSDNIHKPEPESGFSMLQKKGEA
jgi:hypothetical protein